jgi:hypothetical protein
MWDDLVRKEDKQMHKPLNMESCFKAFGEASRWNKYGALLMYLVKTYVLTH